MNNFRVKAKAFYPQYGNYDFALATWTYAGVSNDRLNGNVGETIQLLEKVEVSTIVNESKSVRMQYVDNTTSASFIAPFLDFQLEGLFVGADLLIEFNGASIVGKVEEITGSSNQNLVLDSATRTLLMAENINDTSCYDDIVIKLTTVPDYLTYKYGINPNDLNAPNYKSPLDSNEQAYYVNGIAAINTTMNWIGSEIGSSMGDVVIKFDSTVDSYKHTYTIEHTFVIPYKTEEESNDINQIKNPKDLQSSRTLRYGNGFFFGYEENNTTMTYEDLGEIGNVG